MELRARRPSAISALSERASMNGKTQIRHGGNSTKDHANTVICKDQRPSEYPIWSLAPSASYTSLGIVHDDQASRCDQSRQFMVIEGQQIRVISEPAELNRLPHVFSDDLGSSLDLLTGLKLRIG
ncbi:hypothetical protein KC349_g210 [Hortaea werneckii]|nr:hypothetical protein KC349_g210 [Hortaea werneckii]